MGYEDNSTIGAVWIWNTANATTSAASQLSLISPPTTVQSGVASSAFTVQVQNSIGDSISIAGKSITVGAYTSSTCSTPASGTFSASSSATQSTSASGVASYTSMTYTGTIGTIYLCAKDTTDGYTAALQAVTVTAGTAADLALVSPPTVVQPEPLLLLSQFK